MKTKSKANSQSLLQAAEIRRRLQEALEHSTADETEIVWLEIQRNSLRVGGRSSDDRRTRERTILVRVLDRGRVGSYRTGGSEAGDLADAIRMAAAQSRVREPLAGLPHLPSDSTPPAETRGLFDSDVAELQAKRAQSMLQRTARKRERALLEWGEALITVANTRGVRRQADVTGISLEVQCGRRPGGGRATSASRLLPELDVQDVFDRARSRHASGEVEDPPQEAVPVLLSPESTIELFDLLNRVAFSAAAYSGGTSFLREHLGVQVFDRAICLRDDGTNPAGLPFPFDLEGTAKFPVDLIAQGTPKTPALDQRQAAQLGLPPTAHSITGNDARAQNLFLLPGELSEQDLMREIGDGLWIGSLEHLECRDPLRVRIRARARGVRRIRDGLLGPAIPDLIWEDSLLRILSNVGKLSRDPVRRFAHTGILGGISAPALSITDASGFTAAEDRI